MATVKMFKASNFGTTRGGKRNAEFTANVNSVSMSVRKIELFVIAPEFAPLSDIVTINPDIVPYYAYVPKTGANAILNVDEKNTPENNTANTLINKANNNTSDIWKAAAEYKAKRDAKQAAAILANPEALEMVKELLKQQEATAKKEAAAAKRAAKKAAAAK